MKKTVMTCDRCGHEFVSEYYEDGYIDHVVNFSMGAKTYIEDRDVDQIVETIVWNGNNVRSEHGIKSRLRCFKTWNASADLADQVATKVNKALGAIQRDQLAVERAISKLSISQKAFLQQLVEHAFLHEFIGGQLYEFRDENNDFKIP